MKNEQYFTLNDIERITKGLEKLFKADALNYERYNAKQYDEAKYERINKQNSEKINKIISSFKGVTLSYAGLYPSFKYQGCNFYDVKSLFNFMFELRVKEVK